MKRIKLVSMLSAALIASSVATPVFASEVSDVEEARSPVISQQVAPGFGPAGVVTPELDANITTEHGHPGADINEPVADGFGPAGSVTPELDANIGNNNHNGNHNGNHDSIINKPVSDGFGPLGSVTPELDANIGNNNHNGNHNGNHGSNINKPVSDGFGPVGSVTPELYSDLQLFIKNIYEVALNRDADINGLNFWETSLASGEWSGRQILLNLLNTPEYKGLNISAEEFVTDMYTIINGRAPESAGYKFWVKEYKKVLNYKDQGEARVEILDRMMNESEFRERCGSLGIRF